MRRSLLLLSLGGIFLLPLTKKQANFSGFTLLEVRPRIFTPEEEDQRINQVRFIFQNPNFVEVTVKIFDINGVLIRRNLPQEKENNVIVWDGKDDRGRKVKSGIYLYQIEAEGKVFKGVIIVAK